MKPEASAGSAEQTPDSAHDATPKTPAPEVTSEPPKNLEFVEVPPDDPSVAKPMQDLPPLPKEPEAPAAAAAPPATAPKEVKKPTVATPAKPAASGNQASSRSLVFAISLAVIIFLALAATAFYAYTKSK